MCGHPDQALTHSETPVAATMSSKRDTRAAIPWGRGDVYPRSLREVKCEAADVLAGPPKQQRADAPQVPLPSQAVSSASALGRSVNGETPRLLGTGPPLFTLAGWWADSSPSSSCLIHEIFPEHFNSH